MEVGSNVILVFIRQAYEIGGAWFLELAMKDLAGDQEGLPMQPENLCLVYCALSEHSLIVSYVEVERPTKA